MAASVSKMPEPGAFSLLVIDQLAIQSVRALRPLRGPDLSVDSLLELGAEPCEIRDRDIKSGRKSLNRAPGRVRLASLQKGNRSRRDSSILGESFLGHPLGFSQLLHGCAEGWLWLIRTSHRSTLSKTGKACQVEFS
jgi:hypothetical protein